MTPHLGIGEPSGIFIYLGTRGRQLRLNGFEERKKDRREGKGREGKGSEGKGREGKESRTEVRNL